MIRQRDIADQLLELKRNTVWFLKYFNQKFENGNYNLKYNLK